MTSQNLNELIKRYDPANMYGAIKSFPKQILDSIEQMMNWSPKNPPDTIQNILILGMGGSAIGGDLVKAIIQQDCRVPIIVNRSYHIPNWVGPHTLVIASSYSGNTEETLSGYNEAVSRGAQIISVTTGGKLARLAEKGGYDIVLMVEGYQPRAALGYSFTLLAGLMIRLGFIPDHYFSEIKTAAHSVSEMTVSLNDIQATNPALDYSQKLKNTIPVIYGSEETTWIAALRMRGQLAENSKMMSFHHHIPEQNHNEIEGWGNYPSLLNTLSIVWIPDESDHPRSLARMKITKQLLNGIPGSQIELTCDGENRVTRLLKLIHFIDWISYYLALLNRVDPSPVDRMMMLKSRMSEIAEK